MIAQTGGLYALHTAHTSYLLQVTQTGHLEHLYYGARVETGGDTAAALSLRQAFAPGCTIAYDAAHPALCMEQLRQEISTLGKGDYSEPFVELEFADGSRTCDFLWESAQIEAKKPALEGLPGAAGADEALVLRLREAGGGAALTLVYAVYASCDVITRSAVLENTGSTPLTLHRLASAQLDLEDSNWRFTSFCGGWTNELHRTDTPCNNAVAAESRLGCSSSRANPFVMLSRPDTTETAGEVYGSHLLYSGSHKQAAQPGRWGRLRFLTGIHPEGFAWVLAPGEHFTAPEAALCYTDAGFSALSERLHAFIREHIVRGEWAGRPRPVLMNSWEACYFKFDEAALLRQARLGAQCGVELFVLDDGWFGHRNDDTSSLGDWACNTKKLPGGLAGLSEKLHGIGMDFGLWVEPEMISEDSELYRAHPDWAMRIPGRAHSEGRNQMVLDLANPAVQAYLVDTLASVLSSADIRYIKWDMNRSFSDLYSPWAAAQGLSQGGTAHRYLLGLYHVLADITARFPHVLWEACASGGNRTDLGMLCYMQQVWLSDNTDPICRARIQFDASYGYPPCVMACHVSASPNHQTLRRTPLATRYGAALCGQLGYELDFSALDARERKEITEEITQYRQLRGWQAGAAFYRLGQDARGVSWMQLSQDRAQGLAFVLEPMAQPDRTGRVLRLRGLEETAQYHFTGQGREVELEMLGSLVNTVSPVHIKPGGVLHSLAAQLVHLPGETEDYLLPGSVLNRCGVRLKAPYVGTGLSEQTAVWPDCACRCYRVERTAAQQACLENGAAQPDGAEPQA